MKERMLKEIEDNPNDFKVCENCATINWYERENCKHCLGKRFLESSNAVKLSVGQKISFYKPSTKLRV